MSRFLDSILFGFLGSDFGCLKTKLHLLRTFRLAIRVVTISYRRLTRWRASYLQSIPLRRLNLTLFLWVWFCQNLQIDWSILTRFSLGLEFTSFTDFLWCSSDTRQRRLSCWRILKSKIHCRCLTICFQVNLIITLSIDPNKFAICPQPIGNHQNIANLKLAANKY